MTESPEQPRTNIWLFVMIACLIIAIVSAVTLVALLLTDDDEGIPDAIPIVGDDDDEFERPVLEFTELEDGDTVPLEPQGIEVQATHPIGVDSVQFFIEGTTEVFTATAGGSTDTTVQFPFVPEEPGDYTFVVEATAVDGTAADPIDITVTVEEGDPTETEEPEATATPS